MRLSKAGYEVENIRSSLNYKDVLRYLLGICIAAGLLAAHSKTPPPKLNPAVAPGASSQQDQQIEAAIRAKLAKSKIGKDGFKVRVQGGVAFWEGTTTVVQHKGSATRMAKTAGAHGVVNNIKVRRRRQAEGGG